MLHTKIIIRIRRRRRKKEGDFNAFSSSTVYAQKLKFVS